MGTAGEAVDEERVLICTPTGRDGPLTGDVLIRNGIASRLCRDVETLHAEMERGAGLAIVADEALAEPPAIDAMIATLAKQPPWSDLPIVVFTRFHHDVEPLLARLGTIANVTTVERPARLPTFLSTVHACLRARRRQYQVRALLESLAEADTRKDEFLAMLGHELRNPLAAIRLALGLLSRVGDAAGKIERHRAVIERQTTNLTRMVEDLLDVTRITRGRITLHREPVALGDVVRRACLTCDPGIQARGQRVELAIAPEPAVVLGDEVRLEQVVANLLHNASKYSPPDATILVSVEREGERGAIVVRDRGIGIARENLARVFDVFTQLGSSIDRTEGGLGLGLPLVKGLVALHGGDVAVESEGVGRGSTFTVRLPLCDPIDVPSSPRADGRRAPPVAHGERVLIIEDNADLREGLSDLLTSWGYTVELAADGLDGVMKVAGFEPDVVLVDVGLPLLDGYEVAKRIRVIRKNARLIAMTGYGQPQDRERAMAAGFDRHLVKPVSTELLLTELAAAVVPRDDDGVDDALTLGR